MPQFKPRKRYNLYVFATPANELALIEYIHNQGLRYEDSHIRQIWGSAEQIAILPKSRLVVEDSSSPPNRVAVLVFGIAQLGQYFQLEMEM